ncbi:MAG: cytochrome c biogenesis protein CcsA [Bacteroidales bacterium]|nr:cytochrome c biogenesis protein CcsA [Bacteroidales bacterium]
MRGIKHLNHAGVLVAIVAAVVGSFFLQRAQMTVYTGSRECRALSEKGEQLEPGICVELHEFVAEFYDNQTPRRFASDITVYLKDGESIRGIVEVNRPLKADGWSIYQYGYDTALGSQSPYSVFLLVKDPLLPAVYAGIFLMLAGALCIIFFKAGCAFKRKGILPAALLLMVAASFVYLFTPVFRAKQLMPALQSPWFVPHVAVYMLSYALLAAATLMAFKDKAITDNLTQLGVAFLTIGMLLGAIWAKQAWGHYWTWDPKETWAAITWLCYLLYIHFRIIRPNNWKMARWILLLAFVCLQMCWWGINYLPSAGVVSMHTYNV